MPTRVVLDESPSAIHRESPRGDSRAQAAHFRSTLLRPVIESNIRGESNAIYTSATDIRASPRLAGYLYVLIASVVMVASIAQFYRNEEFGDDPIKNPWINPGSEFIIVGGARVFYWKFVGAFVVAVIGTITSFLIIVAHFDTFFFPRFWRRVFKDGSKIERNILTIYCLFWGVGVQICTSSFSIGATQPNVFFTTWIGLGSSLMTLDLWRNCAEQSNLTEFISRHRMTTVFNWFWTLIFSIITAAAISDMYRNRAHIVFFTGEEGTPEKPSQKMWIQGLSITWSSTATSGLFIMAKMLWKTWKRGWVYFEGFVVAAFVGTYIYICVTYTGIAGYISGPSNAYFGVWGTFFASLITFGTWLRENRSVQQLRQFSSRRLSISSRRGRQQILESTSSP